MTRNDTGQLDGWPEWSKYVLKELEKNDTSHKEMLTMLHRMDREIATLKVKAGAWGLIAGMIPAITVLLLSLLK